VNARNSGPVLVGQPFVITAWNIPVSCNLVCNCQVTNGNGHGTALQIKSGEPVKCPHCQTIYVAWYDPKTQTVQVAMGKDAPQETLQ
jgi:uncharacterized Zn-finger protein